jgi:PKD repeat protein
MMTRQNPSSRQRLLLSGILLLLTFIGFPSATLQAQVAAAFTVDVDSGAAPLTVQFFDQSVPQDSVISRAWDLNGDGATDSGEKNPFWTYETPGRVTVRLVVQDSAGYDTARYVDFVEVAPVEESDIAVAITVIENNAPAVRTVELWGYAGSGVPAPQSPVSLRMPVDSSGTAYFYKGKFLNVLSQNITDVLLLDAQDRVLGKAGFSYPLKDFTAGRRKDAVVILHRDLVSYQDHPREQSAASGWIFPRFLRFPYLAGQPLESLAASGDAVTDPLYQTTVLIPPLSADSAAAGLAQFRLDNLRQDRIPLVLLHGRGHTDGAWGVDADIILSADTADADFNGKRDYAYTSYAARLQRLDRRHADRFDVWQYYYPPDQNWEESGYLFARDLAYLIGLYDTTTAAIAARGMGGLVARSYMEGTARNYTYFAAGTGSVSYRGDIHKAVFLGTPHAGQLRSGLAYAMPDDTPVMAIMDRRAPALRELMPGTPALQRLDPSSLPSGIEVLNIAGTAPAVAPPLPVESARHDDGATALSSATLPAPRTANAILAGYAARMLQTPDDAAGALSAPDPQLLPELIYGFTHSDSTLAPLAGQFLVYNPPDTLRFANASYNPPFALPVRTDVGMPGARLQLQSGGTWPVDGRFRLRLDASSGNRLYVQPLHSFSQLSDPGLYLYPSTMMFSTDPVAQQAGVGTTTFFPVSRSGATHPFRPGLLTLDGLGWQLPVQQQSIFPDPVFTRIDNRERAFDLARAGGDLILSWSRERRNTLGITRHESLLLDTGHPLRALFPDAASGLLEISTDCMTQALTVIVDYAGGTGDPSVSLLAPDASVITAAMANDTTIFATDNSALKMKALTVMSPMPGEWLLLLDGVGILPAGMRAATTTDEMRDLRITLQPEDARSLETVTATVALAPGPPLTQRSATLVLVDSADTRTPIPLRDDGTAPDTLADDGVFAAALALPRAGSYRLEAFYTADAASCSIRRTATLPLPLAPSLELLAPRGGELLRSGDSFSARWQGDRATNVLLDFSTDGGVTWTTVAGPLPATDGSYAWTIPAVTSTACRFRVRDAASGTWSDAAPADFTVYERPVLQMLSPNGAEAWRVDTEQAILWEHIAVQSVDLSYSTDGGSSWLPIEGGVQAASGRYDWRVPVTPSDNCLVRAVSTADPGVTDRSDATFRITPVPAVQLSIPNGGEQWQIQTVQRIRWQSAGIDSVILDFSDDAGATWDEIMRMPAADGEYFWTVPDRVSDDCLIRVTANSSAALRDESDAPFSITPEPFLMLVAPDGGERWEIGTTEYIRWSSAGVRAVDIEYSTDNGQFWVTAAVNIEASLQRYGWDIPREPSEFCRVRIRDTHDSTRGDISAQVFAISESETRPTLFAPTHQSEGVSTRPRFRWIPFAGAVSYHLQVTSDPGMSFWTIEENDLTTSSFQAPELDRDTKYFWRVRARRADNSLSEWSVMWSFTTSGSSLAAPAHYLPLEGALGISTTVNLFWLAAEDADAYHLQVSRTEDFSDLVLEETGLTGLTFAVSGLSHEDDYWWRLRSGNTGSTAFSDWSRPWKFSTAPPPPRQLTPFDGLPDVPLRPLLIWYPTDGARAYHLQVALDDRFNSMVFDSSNIRGTTVQLRSLAGYTTYWWRLTVTTGRGTSDWNDPWMFRTVDIGTGVPHGESVPTALTIDGAWPQPASGRLHLRIHAPAAGTVDVSITDMLGRSVRRYPALTVDSGTAVHTLDLSGLGRGSLILHLRSANGTASQLLQLR